MAYYVEITKDVLGNDMSDTIYSIVDAGIYVGGENSVANDGYRIIEYDAGSGNFRDGDKAVLRTWESGITSETTYNTLGEAETARDALHASDGYEILSLEQPVGSAPTIVVEKRPALWTEYYTVSDYVGQRVNQHGRTDLDRY